MGTFQGRGRLDRSTRRWEYSHRSNLRIVQPFPQPKSYWQHHARGQSGAFSPVSRVEGHATFGTLRTVNPTSATLACAPLDALRRLQQGRQATANVGIGTPSRPQFIRLLRPSSATKDGSPLGSRVRMAVNGMTYHSLNLSI